MAPHAPAHILRNALPALRGELATVAAFSFAANLLMLVPTLYLLQVFDRVLVSRSELTLVAVSLLALALLGMLALLEAARTRVLVRAGARLDARLGRRVFDGCLAESLRGGTPGDAARASDDLLQVRQFATGPGVLAVLDAPWTPIYLAVAYLLHPLLAAVALLFVLLQAALAFGAHRRTVPAARLAARARTDLAAGLQDKLREADTCHALGLLQPLCRRWRRQQDQALARSRAARGLEHRAQAWSKLLRGIQQSLALAVGALLVIEGQLTPGAMIAANLLLLRALAPIDQLVALWPEWAGTAAAWRRLSRLMAGSPPERASAAAADPAGAVELRGVTAHAPGRAHAVLQDVSLRVAPGTVVAVLGHSGAGKSTLGRVVLGLWPGHEGQVLLDGLAVGEWDRDRLGRHVGYLPQDVQLLAGTVAENIARLQAGPSEAVIEAARLAGLHETILRLPGGYDTPVGEAGRLLPGGLRQRLGLARALYADPALLVLDEPDAHLDDAGEAALVRALRQLKARGRTVFLITHLRTGLAALADHALLLRDGRLVASGPRDEVLARAREAETNPAPPLLQPA